MEKPLVVYTDHIINKTLCYNFAKGSDSLMCHVSNFRDYNKSIATYGVLRGTLEIINKVKNYFYMDHGLINLDGYFRIVFNNFVHNGEGNYPNDRLEKLNLKILDQKKYGNYIILSEPSEVMKKLYNVPNWTEDTIKLVKRYTDRKIILHNKFSKEPFKNFIKRCMGFY